MTRLRGLSWGHRRATAPLAALSEAFAHERPDVTIEWTVRPLSDFEHQGVAGAAAQADLVVFDHPFCGDVAASGAFLPLDEPLGEAVAPDASIRYVGPSLDSYRFAGPIWGAPIDGATMHAILRPDLIGVAPATWPTTWDETLALGRSLRRSGRWLGFPRRSPHGFLAAGSIMANLGRPMVSDQATGRPALDRDALEEALERLRALVALCPCEAADWNSIDLHEAMVAREDVALCPCVYGYATYGEADQRRRLAFAPFAGPQDDAGSVVGGAGVGVSARSMQPEASLAFATFCLDEARQAVLVGGHHGQPALRAPWSDPTLDLTFNGFFFAIAPTMDHASVRPRCAGYPAFQAEAGRVVETILAGEASVKTGAGRVLEMARRLSMEVPA